MAVDKIALIFVIIAAAIWALLMFLGFIATGGMAIIVLVPILAVAYLFGHVLSQRLNSREDDYYDKVE